MSYVLMSEMDRSADVYKSEFSKSVKRSKVPSSFCLIPNTFDMVGVQSVETWQKNERTKHIITGQFANKQLLRRVHSRAKTFTFV